MFSEGVQGPGAVICLQALSHYVIKPASNQVPPCWVDPQL